MRLLFALFLLVFTALVVVATHARATVFDPANQITLQENNNLSLNTPSLNKEGYYHNLLALQRQLFLLRKLVERETRNFSLTEDYQKIGLAFSPTPPSAALCRQVPANLSCAEFYAQMYPNFPPAPSLASSSSLGALPSNPFAGIKMAENELPFLPTVADVQDTRDILNWLDITCLEAKCSAVVTPDIADYKARYRVYVGDQLPNGDKISGISAKGVSVTDSKGHTRTIDPAPKPALQALK